MRKILIVLCVLFASHRAHAGAFDETRYCGPPARDAKGQIVRRADVLRAFEHVHPCPAPIGTTCPGWYRDHVIPLAGGGPCP